MSDSKKKEMRDAVRRVAMSYELEDILRKFRKQQQAPMSEEKTLNQLSELLSEEVTSHSIKVNGNAATKTDFITDELNVNTPNSIETCSTQVLNGLTRMKEDLDIFESASAVIDLDSENEKQLNIDVNIKERSRLTARIGASHSFGTPVNGDISVGIRNMFGRGETLEVSSNMGLSGENVKSLQNIVHNTSNEYSIEFKKPRINLPIPFLPINKFASQFSESESDIDRQQLPSSPTSIDNIISSSNNKPYLSVKAFRESLDRSEASSYHKETVGGTVGIISSDLEQCFEYKYHFRSAVIDRRTDGAPDSISPSISDYQFPSVKSSIEYKFLRDTRDSISLPTKGYQSAANIEVAGLVEDVDFIKFWTRFEKHWNLGKDLFNGIFNFGFESGFVLPWKRRVFGNKIHGDEYVRVIDRLIPMAGLQARGFQYAQIGPKDSEGQDYVHCNFLFAIGASLTFPILKQYFLYGNLFCNAIHCGLFRYTNVTAIDENARVSCGASIVLPTPVARIEMGYAHPLRTHGDPFSKWFCSFGVSFF